MILVEKQASLNVDTCKNEEEMEGEHQNKFRS
jgi:hypothetical protein